MLRSAALASSGTVPRADRAATSVDKPAHDEALVLPLAWPRLRAGWKKDRCSFIESLPGSHRTGTATKQIDGAHIKRRARHTPARTSCAYCSKSAAQETRATTLAESPAIPLS